MRTNVVVTIFTVTRSPPHSPSMGVSMTGGSAGFDSPGVTGASPTRNAACVAVAPRASGSTTGAVDRDGVGRDTSHHAKANAGTNMATSSVGGRRTWSNRAKRRTENAKDNVFDLIAGFAPLFARAHESTPVAT